MSSCNYRVWADNFTSILFTVEHAFVMAIKEFMYKSFDSINIVLLNALTL